MNEEPEQPRESISLPPSQDEGHVELENLAPHHALELLQLAMTPFCHEGLVNEENPLEPPEVTALQTAEGREIMPIGTEIEPSKVATNMNTALPGSKRKHLDLEADLGNQENLANDNDVESNGAPITEPPAAEPSIVQNTDPKTRTDKSQIPKPQALAMTYVPSSSNQTVDERLVQIL
ncbi:hypothetical protein M0R45_000329 [Rubus argutus]|uniref:Uncharacterized protein n=1 Tax=Rubus argutus TaxID=59490 RepID=A0AAW1VQH7_RUBAR